MYYRLSELDTCFLKKKLHVPIKNWTEMNRWKFPTASFQAVRKGLRRGWMSELKQLEGANYSKYIVHKSLK